MKVTVSVMYLKELEIESSAIIDLSDFYAKHPRCEEWAKHREMLDKVTEIAIADVQKATGLPFGDYDGYDLGKEVIQAVYGENGEVILEW